IPRPPNAFILFRSEFIKSQHVPGDVEANHGNLSKIIGLCWRNLPFAERDVWECKARIAMAEHKAKYPNYRFKPLQ
ncbi:high mobility group box domain-containing protein, partial [Hysterangium stoloniferum]